MIKNYLKIAWRNLLKNKGQSLINITGLSVGMAVAILIGLWIYDELSYDKYFQNYSSIVQVMQHQTINGDVGTQRNMPIPLGYKLRQDYRGDFKYVVLSRTEGHVISYGDKKLSQQGNFMQAGAANLLTLKMIRGSRAGLTDPSSILLSSSLAKALFNEADPVNQVLKIDDKFSVKVTGVYEDFPHNTTFRDINFISPWDLYMTTQPFLKQFAEHEWGNNSWDIYAQLQPGVDMENVSAKIKNVKLEALKVQGDALSISFKPVLFLQPMNRWHLYSEFKNGINTGGEIEFVWMFGIIGTFVLLLACINFMNLSTARSEKRAREVGIRKTMGSLRSQLIAQFFGESILVVSLAFLCSLVIVQLILPWFNTVADKHMTILWANPLFWIFGLLFSLVTGVIAGSYPAFYLSSFQPVKVLKGTFKAGRFAALPRKVLVVLQFTVSVTLIIGTIVVFRQVQYTQDRPVGYSRTGLVQVPLKTPEIHKQFNAVRNGLLRSGAVIEVAESGSPVTDIWSDNSDITWRGKPPGLQCNFGIVPVSPEFGKTVGWKLVAGRDLSRSYPSDSSALLLNEAAVKFTGLKNPVGETIKWYKKMKVIGVVKDMVMESPYDPVNPTMFYLMPFAGNYANIRLNPKMSSGEAIKKIELIFRQYDPANPFDYQFTDKAYARKFADEERIGKLAGFFTILAIFISCMGLFGMASFTAEQRTKEIGIRKVLGASVISLWRLLSADFVLLVVISMFIAIPTAIYFMNGWLLKYKYRTTLSWWIFAGTVAGAIIITLLTVSYQSIKAALANPVKSLKSE
ncbi:ABC transporter permease [Mucilaginibacter sp.]|uniref:ABC transporter permease n=1 Tax=Mucilaginibacter sp. TaxID=1882438 RepID=UPI00284C2E11|nr:ABC transporter permease [Mucilaginibacter sp.]MDR3695239.1 ABC transporter permease [Mucilaginibacter sp.]